MRTAASLRPRMVQVMPAHWGLILTIEEIYRLVAESGVAGFDQKAQRDRNLVNRELSDLSGNSTHTHSKPSPHLIIRVGRGRYLYREPDRPMDVALLREYLEPVEVYEKRPARRRRVGSDRRSVPDRVRMGLYGVQRGICPGCGFHQPHHLRLDIDHILALSDDGDHQARNRHLLCPYCNRVKATQGPEGFRMKMAELRTHNIRTGVMVDAQQAELTGRRLARYHREIGDETL